MRGTPKVGEWSNPCQASELHGRVIAGLMALTPTEFRTTLRPHANGAVKTLVLRALALGWSEKWRTG